MNKVYSWVWNQSLGQWVVASELASGASAGSAAAVRSGLVTRSLLASSLLALLGLSGGAWAADAVCYDPVTGLPVGTASGDDSEVACGEGAVTSGSQAVAVGTNSAAMGERSIALGVGARALNTTWPGYVGADVESIAIGNAALANGDRAIATGSNANAVGDGAVAIGWSAYANNPNRDDLRRIV